MDCTGSLRLATHCRPPQLPSLPPSLLPTPPLPSLGFVQAVAAAAAWDYRRRREASHVCSVVWRTGVRHSRTQG